MIVWFDNFLMKFCVLLIEVGLFRLIKIWVWKLLLLIWLIIGVSSFFVWMLLVVVWIYFVKCEIGMYILVVMIFMFGCSVFLD